MVFNALGLLYSFLLAAFFSAGITLTPLAVAWGSFWTYFTFILCLIPGYILAWVTIMGIVVIFGLLAMLVGMLGIGAAAGVDSAAQRLRNRTPRSRRF